MKKIAKVIIDGQEAVERALKRFKRMVEREGIIREWRKREFYEKPAATRHKTKKALARKRLKKSRKYFVSR